MKNDTMKVGEKKHIEKQRQQFKNKFYRTQTMQMNVERSTHTNKYATQLSRDIFVNYGKFVHVVQFQFECTLHNKDDAHAPSISIITKIINHT